MHTSVHENMCRTLCVFLVYAFFDCVFVMFGAQSVVRVCASYIYSRHQCSNNKYALQTNSILMMLMMMLLTMWGRDGLRLGANSDTNLIWVAAGGARLFGTATLGYERKHVLRCDDAEHQVVDESM